LGGITAPTMRDKVLDLKVVFDNMYEALKFSFRVSETPPAATDGVSLLRG
jgi:hypothetical protein